MVTVAASENDVTSRRDGHEPEEHEGAHQTRVVLPVLPQVDDDVRGLQRRFSELKEKDGTADSGDK